MADWKIIGLSGLISAVLALILFLFYFPLFLLGPLVGGFLASYMSKVYEDYDKMDIKDGAVMGVLSGIIGGLFISLFIILGLGPINTNIELINNIGIKMDGVLAVYVLIQLSLIISMVLGAVGGVIGVVVKK